MRTLIIVFTLYVAVFAAHGQGIGPGAILVGEAVPIKELRNVINYPSKTLRFADHKPKVTILDFWSTNCRGCVAFWPKLMELQKEFGNDLQVVLVNMREDEKAVKEFFALRKRLSGFVMNLPISCRDSATWGPFNRRSVPRYYWIDSNGVLSAVTHSDQVTSANIKKWIESGPVELEQVVEEMYSVAGNKPIFVDGNGGPGRSESFIWSSVLTKGSRDIFGTTEEYADPINGYGLCKTGSKIFNLYGTAYNNRSPSDQAIAFIHKARIVLETRVSQDAKYNYQLIAGRPLSRQELLKAMREDLDRYFGLKATWEKRKKNCLIFTMFDSTKAQGKSTIKSQFILDTRTDLDSVTVRDAIYFMEQSSFFYDERPIVDETNFKGLLLGIHFFANCYNIKEFDKALSKFGMHIKEEEREVDVLVISDP